MLPLEGRPGLISLLAGKPNENTFPLTAMQLTIRDPLASGKDMAVELSEDELHRGLQYGPTNGWLELHEWVYGLQVLQHERHKDEGWTVSVGAGSQDLVFKVGFLGNPDL